MKKYIDLESFVRDISLLSPFSYSQLNTSQVQSSEVLLDLSRETVEILTSRSAACDHLSKYAVFCILNNKLRSDNFFDNSYYELCSRESLIWFLYDFRDSCEIIKAIPSDSPYLLNIPREYHSALHTPPAFLLWYLHKFPNSPIPSRYKDIYNLYFANQVRFIEDSTSMNLSPKLYETLIYPSEVVSSDPYSFLLPTGKNMFDTTLRGHAETSSIDSKLLMLAFDTTVHNPCTQVFILRLGTSVVQYISSLFVRLGSFHLPAFPLFCYIADKFKGKKLGFQEWAKELHLELSRSSLINWFFHEWVPRFPISIKLVTQELLNSYYFNLNRQIETRKPYYFVVAKWETSSGLTRNAEMTFKALSADTCNYKVEKVSINKSRSYKLYSPHNARTIVHVNADESPYVVMRNKCMLNPQKSVFAYGYYLWETEQIPLSHELGVALVDKILVPTTFLEASYSYIVPNNKVFNVGKGIQMKVSAPEACLSNLLPSSLLNSPNIYKFFTAFDGGSGIERKNPLSLVKAYIEKFSYDDSTHLIIKCSMPRGNSHWGDPFSTYAMIKELSSKSNNITLIDAFLPENELSALIRYADCIISPHRSEGFGYLMIEAIMLNKPLIATRYSGFQIQEETFTGYFPLDYKLISTPNSKFFHNSLSQFWANPSYKQLMQFMKKCAEEKICHFSGAGSIQQSAYDKLIKYYSVSSYKRRLLEVV